MQNSITASDKKTDSKTNNQRIAKNTIFLYLRMFILLAVQLYTSRVVLEALGVEDFGIYSVVGGVVAMFSFLNSAMTSSSQRYITYELGKGNLKRLREVFVTCLNTHILISIVVVVLCETIGLWFIYNKMVIPEERFVAAIWVFQLSLLTTVIAIMSYPYNAVIVAHEKMSAFAYISIIEGVLKLSIVFLLAIGGMDKLILYAILLAIVQLFIRFCYSVYCRKHFEETHYFFFNDRALLKEMLSFAGWNLWGNLSAVLSTNGQNLILNVFFGPIVNAARGIATQVQGALALFYSNMQMAINPQITKSYAVGDLNSMHSLVIRSSKFTYLLLLIIGLPVFIEANFILELWLTEVPDYTVIFLRILIINMLIDATTGSLAISASATGNVRNYQSVVGGLLLLSLPLTYIALRLGGSPESAFIVNIVVSIFAYIARLIIIRQLVGLDVRKYIIEVFGKSILVTVIASVLPALAYFTFEKTALSSVFIIVISVVSAGISSLFGLDKHERDFLINRIKIMLNI